MTETETLHVCNSGTVTPKLKCTEEESKSGEAAPEVQNGVAFKEPPLLREVDPELLQSGKLKYTGKFNSVILTRAALLLLIICPKNKQANKNRQTATQKLQHNTAQ